MDDDAGVVGALEAFDRVFTAGDATGLAACFAEAGMLLLLHRAPLEGRDAIREHWDPFFAAWDTSAWQSERVVVDVHGTHAYALTTYTETLVHRAGTERPRLVVGRLVHFLRRDPNDETWLVTLAMNSHARPVEEVTG